MGLLDSIDFKESAFQPYLNTGTLLDVQAGVFIPGSHGGMILNGGLSTTNAVVGREQMFKSTELMSYIVRAMKHYPQSECFIYDTEYAQKKDRLIKFSTFSDYNTFDGRLKISTPAEETAEEFFEKVKAMCAYKLANPKDFMVDSPLLDPRTGNPMKVWIPTFVVFDSWSEMTSGNVQGILETKVLGSSDTNMIFMKDGIIKKMMLSQIPRLATMAGVYFMMSAHLGNKFELNPRVTSPKSLPFMKAADKPKEVGSNFNFLMSNYLEMRKVEVLVDDKIPIYPTDGSSDSELSEVTAIMLRCKNNMSGTLLPMVVSQTSGIMSDLSNYNYIRKNEYFGLLGSKVHHKPAMTDISVGRTTIREKLNDPKLAHAIELLAQLCYIQNNWVQSPGAEVNFSMKPEVLAEKLLASDSPTTSDILESRSWWTYDKTNKQPYLSLYDVLAIAQGVYKAKGVSLAGLVVPKPSVVTSKKAV
jgi:hypothetical protein